MWTLFFAGYLFAGRRWCAGYGFWSAERSSSSADFVTGTDTRWRPSAGRGSPPPSRPGSANTRPPDQGEWKEVRLNQVKTGQNSTETSIVADLPACGSNRESCGKSRRRVSVAATGGPVPVARSNGPARAPRDSSATAISSSRRRHSPPKKYRPHPRRCCFCHGIEIRLLFTVPLFHLVAPHQCFFFGLNISRSLYPSSLLFLCESEGSIVIAVRFGSEELSVLFNEAWHKFNWELLDNACISLLSLVKLLNPLEKKELERLDASGLLIGWFNWSGARFKRRRRNLERRSVLI